MQSVRRPGLIYPIEQGIAEHDDGIDADLVEFGGHEVYQGAIDPRFTSHDLDVHWLYDDTTNRMGLVEYETQDRTRFSVLWIYSNPYSTFFQEPGWTSKNTTVWSKLSNEAYQDCLNDDFVTFLDMTLGSKTRVILPHMLSDIPTEYYECSECKKRSLSVLHGCTAVKKIPFSSTSFLFLDDTFVIYDPPSDSKVYATATRRLRPEGAGVSGTGAGAGASSGRSGISTSSAVSSDVSARAGAGVDAGADTVSSSSSSMSSANTLAAVTRA